MYRSRGREFIRLVFRYWGIFRWLVPSTILAQVGDLEVLSGRELGARQRFEACTLMKSAEPRAGDHLLRARSAGK